MNNPYVVQTVGFLVSMLVPYLAVAHHSHASLNREDVRVKSGTVTEYLWKSPHIYMKVEAPDDKGEIVEYFMEMGNPMAMSSMGWDKDSWEPGENITWEGMHDKDPDRPYMSLSWAEREDGSRMFTSRQARAHFQEAGGPAQQSAPLEVIPASAIGEGMWSRIAADGGRFKNIYDPSGAMHWPLTGKARARAEAFSEGDNPINRCEYSTPPGVILSLSAFKWERPGNMTITIDRDLWEEKRVIHLNENIKPTGRTPFGHSIGRFEGEELIVETSHLTGGTWGLYRGIDSSENVTMLERYWLSQEGKRLNVELTITDSEMLTEPMTITHQWGKLADRPLIRAECSLEQALYYETAGYEKD
jgi:hypothetical protein